MRRQRSTASCKGGGRSKSTPPRSERGRKQKTSNEDAKLEASCKGRKMQIKTKRHAARDNACYLVLAKDAAW